EEPKTKADGGVAAGTAAIIEERRRDRLQARAALEQAISADAITEFHNDSLNHLQPASRASSQSRSSKKIDEGPSFRQIGIEIIGNRLRQLTTTGKGIYHPLLTTELHEIRIVAKRLR